MADTLQLEQPFKDDSAVRSVNFFNGRLLAGRDLSREQTARKESYARIGRALGEGVAFGFDVARDASDTTRLVVAVEPGLAVNRKGQTLSLAKTARVALDRPTTAIGGGGCVFGDCDAGDGAFVTGAGVYLFTVAPSEIAEGKAPSNGLDPANVRCNTDATVEAVEFRLVWINPLLMQGLTAGASTFRNELAYRCFGAGVQPEWLGDLLGAEPRSDDLLDALRGAGLRDDDAPLALIYFSDNRTLAFIDSWAARRPLSRANTGPLASLVGERRLAVGQAMFLQFADEIANLSAKDFAATTARGRFRYLPPAGVLPIDAEADDVAATQFFAGMTFRGPAFINGARLEGLLRESLSYPPIDTQSGEMIWLYRVRENKMAFDRKTRGASRQYIVFASGHLPYRADAQFDLGRWDYANYALAR